MFGAYCTMNRRLALLVAVLAFAVAPQQASACSCAHWPVREWYEKARMVFVGELVSATPHPTDPCGDEQLTFIATEVFKGGKPGPVVLAHGSLGRRKDGSLPGADEKVCLSPCVSFIEEKSTRIVFAFAEGTQLRYVDCAPNFSMSSADGPSNLRKMRALVKSVAR